MEEMTKEYMAYILPKSNYIQYSDLNFDPICKPLRYVQTSYHDNKIYTQCSPISVHDIILFKLKKKIEIIEISLLEKSERGCTKSRPLVTNRVKMSLVDEKVQFQTGLMDGK